MTEFFSFAGDHPFLFVILLYAITRPFRYAYLAYRYRLRCLNIGARGWPTTPNMDADGDIVHPEKDGGAA